VNVRRRDWRDTVQVAADLALLGLLVALAALPVVTAGAAVATGSAAMHHYLEYDRWPGLRFCWSVFRGRLLSGLLATAVCAAAATLVVVDLLALRAGVVPGGPPLIALTVAVVAVAAGYTGLVVVAAGAADSDRLTGASAAAPARVVRSRATGRPATVASAAAVVALAVVLGMLVHPALSPVLAGYTLFALHVVARRTDVRRLAGESTHIGRTGRSRALR
jgi:hypothetical protein